MIKYYLLIAGVYFLGSCALALAPERKLSIKDCLRRAVFWPLSLADLIFMTYYQFRYRRKVRRRLAAIGRAGK